MDGIMDSMDMSHKESDTTEQLNNNNREQTYKTKAWSPIIWGTKYENVANQLLIIYKNLLFIIEESYVMISHYKTCPTPIEITK